MRNPVEYQSYEPIITGQSPNGLGDRIVERLEDYTPVGNVYADSPRRLRHESRVREAARLWVDCIEGRLDPFFLNQAMHPTSGLAFQMLCKNYPKLFTEAMSTSDFTALTADVLDRELLGYFTAVPIPNLGLAKKVTLHDFRNRKLFIEDGMTTPFNKLGEHEVYEQRALTEGTPITYYPDVYCGGAKITWRAIINDDLGVFRAIPRRLAIAAQRTIHKFITGLYVDANGPHASLFKSGFNNIINTANGASINNPHLSFSGLADALTVLMRQLDPGGDPILIPGKLTLVVGPALWATAKNLMNMITTDVSILGGDQNSAPTTGYPKTRVQVNNWIVGDFNLVMDPYMRVVCTTSTTQDTMWMVFVDPAMQERPALEVGYLTGYDTPQLFSKQPNTQRINGGVDPMMGDFYTMATEMKSIVAFGGTQIDGRSAVSSTGRDA